MWSPTDWMSRHGVRIAPLGLATVLVMSPVSAGRDRTSPVVPVPAPDRPVASLRAREHRYRIDGKIRLLLFWAGRDQVGGARLTWRVDGQRTAAALLAGSNPEHAPRGMNQWIYLREDTGEDLAEVFSVRSIQDLESVPDPASVPRGGSLLRVSCASVNGRGVQTTSTTVGADQRLTYRAFNRLLDQLAVAPRWTAKQTPYPAGAEPGFLLALKRLLTSALDRDPSSVQLAPIPYVYNGTVYDLTLDETESLSEPPRLLSRFRIRNRTLGSVTRFSVTFAPDEHGAAVPLLILYQPNWWLRIELRLDESANVPSDPGGDEQALSRIRQVCASATARAVDH